MTSAKTLAEYLIYLNHKIQGQDTDITPMKLQKLLYYCQGYSLALTGKPIFSEPIKAWTHGPVIDSVYQEYKKYKNAVIPVNEKINFEDIDETVKSIADFVVDEKKWLNAYALSDSTHREDPWKSTFEGKTYFYNKTIPNEKIKDFFSREFLKWEESEDEEDSLWLSVGKPVSREEMEAALAEI